jgi:hypothetical protein
MMALLALGVLLLAAGIVLVIAACAGGRSQAGTSKAGSPSAISAENFSALTGRLNK